MQQAFAEFSDSLDPHNTFSLRVADSAGVRHDTAELPSCCSMPAMPPRCASSRALSSELTRDRRLAISLLRKSSTLLRRWSRSARPLPLSLEKSRSKINLGFTSLGSGWVADRHDIVEE